MMKPQDEIDLRRTNHEVFYTVFNFTVLNSQNLQASSMIYQPLQEEAPMLAAMFPYGASDEQRVRPLNSVSCYAQILTWLSVCNWG